MPACEHAPGVQVVDMGKASLGNIGSRQVGRQSTERTLHMWSEQVSTLLSRNVMRSW